MKRYQNISLCQIDVKTGVSEYYLPKNANWRDKKIEKIVVYAPDDNVSVTSPINDAAVSVRSDIVDLYFDLFNADGQNILHNIHAYELLDANNYPLEIGQKLSFDLSRIFFTSAPTSDGALMLYIFYNDTDTLADEATENVTIRFDVAAKSQVSFVEAIENYMYARSKGVRAIAVWNDRTTLDYNSGFMTLRDTTGMLAHEQLPTYFFRPVIEPVSGDIMLKHHIALDVVELDMYNSYMYNPHNQTITYIITFYY